MDTVGIFVLVAGIWLLYSGVTGIPPLETFQKIISSPRDASKIIADARAASPKLADRIDAGDGNSGAGLDGLKGFAISRGFRQHEKDGSGAPGIDFIMPVGTPVIAPIGGTLEVTPLAGNWGNRVVIVRGNGDRIGFAHLSQMATDKKGQRDSTGTVIGKSGGKAGAYGSGNSTGPHLHVDVTVNGSYVDPAKYFTGLT
jgi:murein DD-endopeptidase MepM/ murein hydrolase activator NlpD